VPTLALQLAAGATTEAAAQTSEETTPASEEVIDIGEELASIRAELDATREDASAAASRESDAQARFVALEARLLEIEAEAEQERTRAVTRDDRMPASAAAGEVRSLPGEARTVLKRSNIRRGPGTEHPILATIEAGTVVTAFGVIGQWTRIAGEGIGAGWIYSELLGSPD
jgi:uncharacterized protein YgiM (DUF1202 family)